MSAWLTAAQFAATPEGQKAVGNLSQTVGSLFNLGAGVLSSVTGRKIAPVKVAPPVARRVVRNSYSQARPPVIAPTGQSVTVARPKGDSFLEGIFGPSDSEKQTQLLLVGGAVGLGLFFLYNQQRQRGRK